MIRQTKFTDNQCWTHILWKRPCDEGSGSCNVPTFLIDDLLSHWTLNEVSGTRADSLSTNPLLLFPGPVGSAAAGFGNVGTTVASFNGTRDLETNSNLVGGPFGSFTLSIWVNSPNFNTGRPIMQNSNGGVKGFLLGLGWNGNITLIGSHDLPNAVSFVINPSHGPDPGGGLVTSGTNLIPGAWNLVVAWYDSVTKEIGVSISNVNGVFTTVLLGSLSPSGYTYENGTWLSIANNGLWFASPMYAGYAVSADIWNRVIPSCGINALYNSGNGISFTSYSTTRG